MRIACIALIGLFGGCASVPEGASSTGEAVSEGVRRLRDQHLATIEAFAAAVRAEIQRTWDREILPETIAALAGAADPVPREKVAEIAATAAEVRDRLLAMVDERESLLAAEVRRNYATVLEMNAVVTGYLASLEELRDAQAGIKDRLLGLTGMPAAGMPAAIRELLEIAEDPKKER